MWQIEKSTQILEDLLNSKHVFIAASWRLKALLLEGLAANTENEQVSYISVWYSLEVRRNKFFQ